MHSIDHSTELNANASTIVPMAANEYFPTETAAPESGRFQHIKPCSARKRRSGTDRPTNTNINTLERKGKLRISTSKVGCRTLGFEQSTSPGQQRSRPTKCNIYPKDNDDDTLVESMEYSVSASEDTSYIFERLKRKTKKQKSTTKKEASTKEVGRRKQCAKKQSKAAEYEGEQSSLVHDTAEKGKQSERKTKRQRCVESSLDVAGSASRNGRDMRKKKMENPKTHTAKSPGGEGVGVTAERAQSFWCSTKISTSLTDTRERGSVDPSSFSYTPTWVKPRCSKLSYNNVTSMEEYTSKTKGNESLENSSPPIASRGNSTNRSEGKNSVPATFLQSAESATKAPTARCSDAGGRKKSATVSFARQTEVIEYSANEGKSSTKSEGNDFDSSNPNEGSCGSVLPPPEISWGDRRVNTPGKRRSLRTRVRRLRPELGEAIKYEYIGGPRKIAGVVPGRVIIPLLKK